MAKVTRDKYRGKAVIMNISLVAADDWKDWEKRDLSEIDKTNAFKIVYDVAEGDANGARHDVEVELSHRELKGKLLDYYKREDGSMPTQMDVAVRTLERQGILPKGATQDDLGAAIDDKLCGREVFIRAYEEQGKDGASWWPRCQFASRFQRITGDEKASRLAAFLGGKPAVKAEPMPAAPAEDPSDDMPF